MSMSMSMSTNFQKSGLWTFPTRCHENSCLVGEGDFVEGEAFHHEASHLRRETLLLLADATNGDINGRVRGRCCVVKWQCCQIRSCTVKC